MDTDSRITAVLALRKAKRIVVFTGAGMSAESGIPTFRDTDAFWQRFPPERFASWRGLLQTALTDPHSVAEFVLNVVRNRTPGTWQWPNSISEPKPPS